LAQRIETGGESEGARQQRLFRARFGVELEDPSERYTLGPAAPPTPELAAHPAIADALTRADQGRVRTQAMTLASGESLVLVTFHLGDTRCGFILDGTQVIAEISDGEIRPVSGA
jgi:hypothetical protein